LRETIQDLDVRVRLSEQNQKLIDSYTEKVKKLEENIGLCNGVINIIKPMLEDVQEYITKRRKNSMQNINNALRIAGEIIQDATEGIYFKMDGDEAWLSTPDGLEVDIVEGGGYRQISSTFIRSVVLAANSQTLNTLMLDEIFALVSPENSATLSLYLNVMCQDKQVISIEQKPQVYSNIDSITYKFIADEKYTEVTKKVIKRGDFVEQGGVDNAVQVN
jgi:hypothetical protein